MPDGPTVTTEQLTGPPMALGRPADAGPSPTRQLVRRMRRVRMAPTGAMLVAFFVVLALAAGLLSPRDPLAQDLGSVVQAPSWAHPFGTDNLGRDVLSRAIHGSRISLEVGLIANALALVIGVPLGLIAGFSRTALDHVVMRVLDGILAFPALVLAVAIAAVLGPSLWTVIIAITVTSVPYIARLARGETLSVREQEYVLAAVSLGAPQGHIINRHVLPNILAPIIVQSSLNISFAMLAEAALSFLGVGIQPPAPSWGSMLQAGYRYVEIAPWLVLAPGAAIFLAVLGFNFVSDGLRETLDPRLRQL